jgi:DMSO/TMAO reductase YedYZ molybdopterin-dependent catalytic subunit
MKPVKLFVCFLMALLVAVPLLAEERVLLDPDTPDSEIIYMHPKDVDPSRLPLDTIEDLHTTGVPPEINVRRWRLLVTRNDEVVASFSYRQLLKMDSVQKKVLLICPAFFADYAEWKGVPLQTVLKEAGIGDDYSEIVFHAEDGYQSIFPKSDVDENFLFLAYSVNGRELPPEHGFPLRLVAENVLGGRWIKWISRIEVK